jgi:glucose/arabinose dehydrogenase
LFFISKKKFEERKLIFTKIKTNIKKIASEYKNELVQVKDFLLKENYIYISYLNKKNDKCFENKVIRGEISLDEIYLEDFFSTNECRKESTPSVGGNLSKYTKNKILLTIGDYYCYEREKLDFCKKNLPQSNESFMGKIIALDENLKDFQIMSIGHRNSQGLFYDFEKDIIWSTDHGPEGGDEININIKPKNSIKNYGWPIASYGNHYEGPGLKEKYKIAPLKKSHSEFNFIEPLKFFTPALGISQIIKVKGFFSEKNDELFVGSLGFDLEEGDLSLHYFKLDSDNKILTQKIIPVKERIRDIEYISDLDLIVLFLETNGSIAIIEKI